MTMFDFREITTLGLLNARKNIYLSFQDDYKFLITFF